MPCCRTSANNDRLPCWPKINPAYLRAQSLPFRDMEIEALHDWTGSDRHVHIPSCVTELRSRTSVDTSEARGVARTVFWTPGRETELVQVFHEASQSWHPKEFPVRSIEHVRHMTEVFQDVTVLWTEKLSIRRNHKRHPLGNRQ